MITIREKFIIFYESRENFYPNDIQMLIKIATGFQIVDKSLASEIIQ